MNLDVSTGPLTCPFARSFTFLFHLLTPHCLLSLRALLRSFVFLLAQSLTPELVRKFMIRCLNIRVFWTIVQRNNREGAYQRGQIYDKYVEEKRTLSLAVHSTLNDHNHFGRALEKERMGVNGEDRYANCSKSPSQFFFSSAYILVRTLDKIKKKDRSELCPILVGER